MRTLGFVPWLLLNTVLTASSVWGHERWLEPQPYLSAAPGVVKIYLVTGELFRQTELVPERSLDQILRFQAFSAAGRRELRSRLREDQQPLAILTAGDLAAGTSTLVLDKAPIDIELDAEKFQRYLLEERLIDVLLLRAQRGQEDDPGRERYSRHIKALVQVGPRRDEDATVARPVGQALEIVPQQNPYRLAPGDPWTVQVRFQDKPLPGRALGVAHRAAGKITQQVVRTNGAGEVRLTLTGPGDWLLALVHMEPSREPGADWRSYFSSLSFQLPAR